MSVSSTEYPAAQVTADSICKVKSCHSENWYPTTAQSPSNIKQIDFGGSVTTLEKHTDKEGKSGTQTTVNLSLVWAWVYHNTKKQYTWNCACNVAFTLNRRYIQVLEFNQSSLMMVGAQRKPRNKRGGSWFMGLVLVKLKLKWLVYLVS